jgi:hypothetical protein
VLQFWVLANEIQALVFLSKHGPVQVFAAVERDRDWLAMQSFRDPALQGVTKEIIQREGGNKFFFAQMKRKNVISREV